EVAFEGNRPSERRMTFFEHLEELRQRLRIVIVVVIILFVLNLTTSIGPVSIGSTQVPMLLPALGPTSPNLATQFFLAMKNLLVANLLILYGDSFIDFVLLFTLAFGIAFQLPVLMYGLTVLGIVPANFWKKYWRFATIAIVVFGAIITPDGSGITMFLVALPMLALYAGGYVAAVSLEKHRARAKA